ncbi:hypothetical protein [Spongiibacter marinus]|uniref:hypothetical protein n=1 Tax=Spongiibacter marinus TaxID=354246 RepID=UPI0035BE5DA5
MYAFIYMDAPPAEEMCRSLSIAGKNVGFFLDPIRKSASFSSNLSGDEWGLIFFVGSARETALKVSVLSSDEEPHGTPASKAIWLNNQYDSEKNAEHIEQASKFVRDSKTLTLESYQPTAGDRGIVADRQCLAYFSGSEDQFRRVVLAQALAVAYKKVMYDCMAELSEAVRENNIEATISLYEEILQFNAGSYFRHPIKLELHEMSAVWDILAQHFRLQELNRELTDQLTGFAMLLREEREKALHQREIDRDRNERSAREKRDEIAAALRAADDKRDRSFHRRVTIVALLAAVLMMVELTPRHFRDFYTNWFESGYTRVAAFIDGKISTQ